MEPAVGASPTTWTHEAGGAAWRLTLDRSNLLPGRLVEGTLENLGAYNRVITGTWSQGGVKGGFRLVRN